MDSENKRSSCLVVALVNMRAKPFSLAAGMVLHAVWKVTVCWSAISTFLIGLLLITGQLKESPFLLILVFRCSVSPQILIFKPEIFLAGELEHALNCLSLNEGLWLWWTETFWPFMIAFAASLELLNEWKFYNRVTVPTDKCLFWACSLCQTTKMLWSCVTLALWLDASLIHVLQNKHI